MNLPGLLPSIVHSDRPLGELTWFGLGGPARWMAMPQTVEQLVELLEWAGNEEVPWRILGGGANLLVCDEGFDGLVIRLGGGEFERVHGENGRLHVGGAVDMFRLVRETAAAGRAGLEVLAGIPGTLGGCIRMNAGGRYGQIADVVESVEVVDACGRRVTLTHEQVGFGYRQTNLDGYVVVGATLRLEEADPDPVRERMQEIWNAKKAEQPMAAHSAGCIFRNPPGESAGRLIDRAGLKGLSDGRARVSEKHANFIVADEGAKAADVLRLIDRVTEAVERAHGVRLSLEIDVWR